MRIGSSPTTDAVRYLSVPRLLPNLSDANIRSLLNSPIRFNTASHCQTQPTQLLLRVLSSFSSHAQIFTQTTHAVCYTSFINNTPVFGRCDSRQSNMLKERSAISRVHLVLPLGQDRSIFMLNEINERHVLRGVRYMTQRRRHIGEFAESAISVSLYTECKSQWHACLTRRRKWHRCELTKSLCMARHREQ